MTVAARDLHYPLLCLSREMGVCVVGSAPALERCRAVVYWRGKFFQDLRVVGPNGDTHEIVRATVRKPASRWGQRVARLFDLPVFVDVEAVASPPMSLADVIQVVEKAVDEDPETFEEFSGHSVDWWKQSLARCRTIPELMRTLQT